MLRKIVYILFIAITLHSCGTQSDNDIYETESGEYASKKGNFIIDLPKEPTLRVIDNQVGMDKYKVYYYQAVMGKQMIYGIEFIDFPEYVMKTLDKEAAYNQALKTLEAKYNGVFKLTTQEPTEQHNLKGQYFEYTLNKNANVPDGVKGSIRGKIFYIENRAYTITYLGEHHDLIESYLDSFRLIE